MTTGGLELVGSRPPSRLDTRQLTSSRTHRAATDRGDFNTTRSDFNNQTYTKGHNKLETPDSPNNRDLIGRTFSRGWLHADNNARTTSPMLSTSTMLSDRPSSRQQSSRSILSERPPSGLKTPSTGRHITKRTERRRMSSYVDESLFGQTPQEASFTAPWESNKSNPNRTVSSRPSSAMKLATRQPSYVDNSLFGEQIETATWLAPWQKTTNRRKPLLFDSSDYRLTVEHDIETVKEYKGHSSRLHRANSLGSINKPQPWR